MLDSRTAISGQPVVDVVTGVDGDSNPPASESAVLIVDDVPANTAVFQAYLEDSGFSRFITCCDPSDAVATLIHKQPDAVLADLASGYNILSAKRSEPSLKQIRVVILTSSDDKEAKLRALEIGAADILSTAVDAAELVFRLRNILVIKSDHDELAKQTALLEQEVRQKTKESRVAQQQILLSLASAGEFRDEDTGKHVMRVGRYSGVLARHLGASDEWVRMIEQAAPLHDVGKIGIPDSILLKPDKLNETEFDVMKRHGAIGTQIISAATRKRLAHWADQLPQEIDSPIMQMAAVIAETHHEKWDGSGYPKGLKGEEIAPEGRIVAVADVYDALSNSRPYKKAYSHERCFEIIKEERGTHFDPRVVDAFFATQDEILQIQSEFSG